ncbi:tatD [Mytilus coruscus]|uniref:TatD n=1 Tax=Mytilus coruscus TaxID=42192 RepID=A0A6J8CXV2_MYTCO|nr:tatD [Mytilus coruscus]
MSRVIQYFIDSGKMREDELDYEEDQDHLNDAKRQVAIRGEAKNARLRHRECDICFHTFTNPRRHTIQIHLHVPGSDVRRANGLLRELARALGTSFPVGLEEKLNAIMRIRTQLPLTEFHISEFKLVDAFLKLNCLEPALNYKITSTPFMKYHHILHWKILKNLIGYLNSDEQLWFLKFEERKNKEGLQIGQLSIKLLGPLQVIDSQFHLDQLCRQMVSGALQDLDDLVLRALAVGEIGLDDSTYPSKRDFERQIKYFRKQLVLATELNLTVVIHSRGKPSLHEHVLTTPSEICKPDQLIHWHCFTCTTQLYSAAVSQFPNIVFGITPFILKDRYSSIVEIVKTFGITHLVLESDAPYIPLHSHTFGNPYSVNAVAQKISKLLQQPIEEVFRITTENSKRIYKLQ